MANGGKHKAVDWGRLTRLLLFVAAFFNPVVLLLLFRSCCAALLVPILLFAGGWLLGRLNSFRVMVWAFNVFAVIGIALNAELAFRQLAGDKIIPNIYAIKGNYYFNKPMLDQQFTDEEFSSHYLTNIQGYRIDELTDPNDSVKECDWLFIGDSFTQGAQVNYDELFSTLIYPSFPDKVIVNAGMSGAGLHEELNYLKDMGKALRPKKIFLQIGAFNDFYNIREHIAGWSEHLMDMSDLFRYIQYNLIDRPNLPLNRWAEPFFEQEEENRSFNVFYKPASEQKEADRRAFAEVLADFKKEADSLNAELIVMLIPSKEQISEELLKEVTTKFGIDPKNLDMDAPNALTRQVCSKLGLRLVDFTPSFKASSHFPFFERDEHLNQTGHELIAREICQTFASESGAFSRFSKANQGDRYPTFFDDGLSMLYQSQTKGTHRIIASNLIHTREDVLWESLQELIHPMISGDGKWMVFTQGNQSRGETDVILYNFELQEDSRINPPGWRGAIATFSHDCKLAAFPKWRDENNPVISVYDIQQRKEVASFGNREVENWRPVFSLDDKSIYYLSTGKDGNFRVITHEISTGSESVLIDPPYNIWDIALSPDGRRLVYAGNKNGNWDLFLYDIPSQSTLQLTNTIGNEWDPVFSPDGREIWFAGEFGFNNGIYHIPAPQ